MDPTNAGGYILLVYLISIVGGGILLEINNYIDNRKYTKIKQTEEINKKLDLIFGTDREQWKV